MKAPCKGCMSRHEACHYECAKYIAYRQRLAEAKEERERERIVNDFAISRAAKNAKVKQSFQK